MSVSRHFWAQNRISTLNFISPDNVLNKNLFSYLLLILSVSLSLLLPLFLRALACRLHKFNVNYISIPNLILIYIHWQHFVPLQEVTSCTVLQRKVTRRTVRWSLWRIQGLRPILWYKSAPFCPLKKWVWTPWSCPNLRKGFELQKYQLKHLTSCVNLFGNVIQTGSKQQPVNSGFSIKSKQFLVFKSNWFLIGSFLCCEYEWMWSF